MSARVPEPLRLWPVISGIGRFESSGWYLKRYQYVFVGRPTPGHTTAFRPQDVTTVPLGTPNARNTGSAFFCFFLGSDAVSFASVTRSFFALRDVSSASFVGAGPTITF